MNTNHLDPKRWKALALLSIASFMVILDASIVLVALPSIESDLGLSASSLQWVLSGYALSFGGLLLLGGRTADLLGRRRMFMVGTGLFALASLASGLATSEEVLIGGRVLQGVSAAIMSPTALSILVTTFPEGAERNKALGVWSAVGGLGGTAGVLVGGPITSGLGWEWIFFINIPVAAALIGLSPALLRESRAALERRSFDVAGAAAVTASLVMLVYAVVEAPEAGWTSPQTLLLVVASVALAGLFAVIESRSAAPLMPLRVLRSRTLVGGNLVLLVVGMLAFGVSFILTLYAQQVLGYTPLEYGLASAVLPVMATVGSVTGQSIVTKTGYRRMAIGGLGLMGLGSLLLTSVSAHGSYLGDLFLGLLVFGPGLGAAFVAAAIATVAGVDDAEAGLASGLNNASFQIGGALGIAILASVAVAQTDGSDPLTALTAGFQSAFAAAVVLAAAGILVAAILLGEGRRTGAAVPEPAAA
jgi:EmrB/QacA subfamily drug resistance transporter